MNIYDEPEIDNQDTTIILPVDADDPAVTVTMISCDGREHEGVRVGSTLYIVMLANGFYVKG